MDDLFYSVPRTEAAMASGGIDVLLAATAPNIQYLTGYRRGGDSLALLQRNDLPHPHLVVHSSNIDYCLEDPVDGVQPHGFGFYARLFADSVELDQREQFIQRLYHASKTTASRWDTAAELLRVAGLQSGVVATDVSSDGLAPLLALLPGLQVKSVPDLYRRLRSVKTEKEIKRIEEAARITEHAIFTSAQSACLGTTQRQLARVFDLTVITANAYLRSDNASVGRGSALGNVNSPKDIVAEGSIIRYDVGVHYQGYASDIARSFVFKKAGDKERRIHDAIVAGLEKEIEMIRPGVAACEIFEAAVDCVRHSGIPDFERHHVGHGIGIAGGGYDPPLLGPQDRTVLEPGMILCVETPYVEVGFGCLQVEDMLVVTTGGSRLLTHTDRSLQVLP